MNRDEVSFILDKALDNLISSQITLLDLDVAERTLCHHLAICIGKLIPSMYDVDVEYNRLGVETKRLMHSLTQAKRRRFLQYSSRQSR